MLQRQCSCPFQFLVGPAAPAPLPKLLLASATADAHPLQIRCLSSLQATALQSGLARLVRAQSCNIMIYMTICGETGAGGAGSLQNLETCSECRSSIAQN